MLATPWRVVTFFDATRVTATFFVYYQWSTVIRTPTTYCRLFATAKLPVGIRVVERDLNNGELSISSNCWVKWSVREGETHTKHKLALTVAATSKQAITAPDRQVKANQVKKVIQGIKIIFYKEKCIDPMSRRI